MTLIQNMNPTPRDNFFRYMTLIIDIGYEAAWELLDYYLSKQGITLKDFIENNQHDIYHLCYNKGLCCRCQYGPVHKPQSRILYPAQLHILLDTKGTNIPCNVHVRSKPTCSHTINDYFANPNIAIKQLDLTLCRCLLFNFTNILPYGSVERTAFEDLINMRNECCHAAEGEISSKDYRAYKADIEKCLLALAKVYGKTYEMQLKFKDADKRPFDESICKQLQQTILQVQVLQGESGLHEQIKSSREAEMHTAAEIQKMDKSTKRTLQVVKSSKKSVEHIASKVQKLDENTEKTLKAVEASQKSIQINSATLEKQQDENAERTLQAVKYTAANIEKKLEESSERTIQAVESSQELVQHTVAKLQKLEENTEKTMHAIDFSRKAEEKRASKIQKHEESLSKWEIDVHCISKKNSPEQRFIRCAMVAVQEIPKIMQEIMKQSEMPPATLYNLIQNNEPFKKVMPTTDQNAYGLQSLLKDGYTKLHVTLMFNIVRHYSNMFIPTPKQGWDKDPNHDDGHIGDDTQRMRKMIYKIKTTPSKTFSKGEFKEFFTHICAISVRIDEYFYKKSCVTTFQKNIYDLLFCPIDKEMEEKALEETICLKDYFVIKSGEKEVSVFRGESLQNYFQRMADCDANTTAPITMRFPGIKGDQEIATLVNTLQDQINDRSLPIKLDGAAVGSLILFLRVENNVFKSDIETREVISSLIEHFIKVTNLQQWLCQPKNIVEVVITNEYFWNSRYIREENQSQRNDSVGCVLLNLEVNKAGFHREEHHHNLTFKNKGKELGNDSELIAVIRPIKTVFVEGSIDLEEDANEKEHVEHKSEISAADQHENWENFLKISILVDDHLKAILVSLIAFHLREKHLTFEQFLNRNQHMIYHMCYNLGRCCSCLEDFPQKQNDRVLFPIHMDILFDKNNKMPGHRPNHGSNFCCSFAKSGISTDVLDVILARCLLINFCADVFWYGCLQFQGISFENFLNKNKHLLYHLWQNNTRCCQCSSPVQTSLNCQIVNEQQWTDMFATSSNSTPCRQRSPITHCICSISAKPGISQVDLAHVLQHTLLEYCCSTFKSVETLVKIRRNVYGHIEKAQITDLDYNTYKNDIKSAVLSLAIICGKEQEVKKAFNDLNHRSLDYSLLDSTEVKALVHASQNANKQQTTKLKIFEKNKKRSFNDIGDSKNEDETRLTKLLKPIDITESDIRYKGPSQNALVHTSAKIRRFEKNTENSRQVVSLEQNSMEVAISTKQKSVSRQETSERSRLLGLTQMEIDEHLKEGTFVETPAVQACIKLLERNSLLLLTGAAGTGKSRYSLEILHQFRVKYPEYETIKLIDLHGFTDFMPVKEKLVILFEDIFGRSNTRFAENTDIQFVDRIHACTIKGNIKVIMTIRDTIKMSCHWILNSHKIFHGMCEVDLSSEKFKMRKTEKESLLLNYFVAHNFQLLGYNDQENYFEEAILDPKITATVNRVTFLNIVESEPLLGFPETCSLFTGNRKLTRLGLSFFKHPSKYLYEEIEKLRKHGKDNEQDRMSYVTLVYILLNEDVLDPDNIELNICCEILESCYGILYKRLPACHITDAAKEMIGRYLIFNFAEGTYHLQHLTIFESILISYSRIDPELILSRLSFDFIREMVRLKNYTVKEEEVVMEISTKYYSMLANRIVELILSEYFNKSMSLNFQLLCESEIIRQNDQCFMICLIEKAHDAYFQPDYDLQTFVTYRGVCKLCKLYLPASLLERITQQNKMNDSITLLVDHITLMLNSKSEKDIEFVCKSSMLDAFLNVCYLENNENMLDNIWVSVRSLDLSEMTEYIKSSINTVCSRCPMTTMKWMLNNIDRAIFDMNQLLKRACEFKRLDIVQFLCETINHNQLDFTAAFVAAINNVWNDTDESVSKWLINNIDLQLFDMKQITSEVLKVGCIDDVKFLLRNVDNNMLDIKSVFTKIYKEGKHSIERFFKWMVAVVEKEKLNTLEMLIQACVAEEIEMVKTLFDKIDHTILACTSVLMSAVNNDWKGNNKDLIEWLFLNVNLKFNNMILIIEVALENQRYEELRILLKHATDKLLNVNTVLQNACRSKQIELIRIVLSEVNHKRLNIGEAVRLVCEEKEVGILNVFLHSVDDKLYDVSYVMKTSCTFGWIESVNWLLDNVNHSSLDIIEAMHIVFNNQFEMSVDVMIMLGISKTDSDFKSNEALIKLIFEKVDHDIIDLKETMNIACHYGWLDVVNFVLKKDKYAVLDVNTIMIEAYRHGWLDVVKLLLENVDPTLLDMKTVMRKACDCGWLDVVKWLLKNVDHTVLDMKIAMNEACGYGLLDNVDQKLLDMKTVMNKACDYGWLDLVKFLIENVDNTLLDMNTVVNEACDNGWLDLVKLLLENVDHTLLDMKTVMNKACDYGWLDLVKLLFENVDHKLFDIKTGMNNACESGWVDLVKLLLENVDHTLLDMKTVMNKACDYGWLDLVKFLIENVDHTLLDMNNAVNEACESGRLDLVKLLLENVDHTLLDMKTIMDKACDYGWLDLVKLLLDYTVLDIKTIMNKGCESGSLDVVKYLTENFDNKLFDIKTGMNKACESGSLDVVKYLTENFDNKLFDIKTGMNKACESGSLDVV